MQVQATKIEDQNKQQTIKGEVEKIIFHSPDNGYTVFKIIDAGISNIVSGNVLNLQVHEFVKATGEYEITKYGKQFKAKTIETSPPSDLENMVSYLSSGLIKGIGPSLAVKIVDKFKYRTFEVFDNSINELLEVDGIGNSKLESIAESWRNQKGVKDVMMFLTSHGVSTSKAAKIYKLYGDDSVKIISHNPYQLADDIVGIAFKSADIIARELGFTSNSIARLRAGTLYALNEMKNQGHCAVPADLLVDHSIKLLSVDGEDPIHEASLREVINRQIHDDIFALVDDLIYLPKVLEAEISVSDNLLRLKSKRSFLRSINIEEAIKNEEKNSFISLSDKQKDAIRQVAQNQISIITGGPGVGKTTLVNSILNILKANDFTFNLCAPTGRAAKRINETSGEEAKTIHSLLEYNPASNGFMRNPANPLKCDFLIIDESSMIDVLLMDALLSAVEDKTCVIIVGDVDQLPSIGPGQVLKDIIDSGEISVIKLTEIFRQAKESKIITNSYRINNGLLPLNAPKGAISDFYYINQSDPEKIQSLIIEMVTKRIPTKFGFDPVKDIQVLIPMNRGLLGVKALNTKLQKLLNPQTRSIEKAGINFSLNDKVMQLKNDYNKKVFNGDIGYIASIDEEERELTVAFDGNRFVEYSFQDLDQIRLAYASSIHKSQGSEYKVVVMGVHTQHYTLLQKNLIYTGITRGKNLVVLIGCEKALNIALSRTTGAVRYTQLKRWLRNASEIR